VFYACVLSCVWLFATPWTVACQTPLSMKFSRQEYWSGLPFPAPGDLPNPEVEPASLESPALAGRFFTAALPRKTVYWSFPSLSPTFSKSSEWLRDDYQQCTTKQHHVSQALKTDRLFIRKKGRREEEKPCLPVLILYFRSWVCAHWF